MPFLPPPPPPKRCNATDQHGPCYCADCIRARGASAKTQKDFYALSNDELAAAITAAHERAHKHSDIGLMHTDHLGRLLNIQAARASVINTKDVV